MGMFTYSTHSPVYVTPIFQRGNQDSELNRGWNSTYFLIPYQVSKRLAFLLVACGSPNLIIKSFFGKVCNSSIFTILDYFFSKAGPPTRPCKTLESCSHEHLQFYCLVWYLDLYPLLPLIFSCSRCCAFLFLLVFFLTHSGISLAKWSVGLPLFWHLGAHQM